MPAVIDVVHHTHLSFFGATRRFRSSLITSRGPAIGHVAKRSDRYHYIAVEMQTVLSPTKRYQLRHFRKRRWCLRLYRVSETGFPNPKRR